MKYANMDFVGKSICNLGDNLQLMAIDNLYEQFGVEKKDVIRVPYEKLNTWKSATGERVLLPINFPFLEYPDEGRLSNFFSDDIEPIFLGLTYIKPYLDEKEVDYFKKHEPIGCRDEYTFQTMQKYGIQSWLNGCMTLTYFQKREVRDTQNQIFLVDVDEEIENKLPQYITSKAIRISQNVNRKSIKGEINLFVNNRFAEYSRNAKLVITSKLHCAVPCISIGIPVVLLMERVSFRFSWLEKLIPIYTIEDIGKIDWTQKTDAEEVKRKVLANALNMLQMKAEGHCGLLKEAEDISKLYLSRNRMNYYVEGYDRGIEYLIQKYDENSEFEYSVWGLTFIAEMLCHYIEEHYPKARLVQAFDNVKRCDFRKLNTCAIESVNWELLQHLEVLVTAWAATNAAKNYFELIGKDNRYCLCYEND